MKICDLKFKDNSNKDSYSNDYVYCTNCLHKTLVPVGTEICPLCESENGTLCFVNENVPTVNEEREEAIAYEIFYEENKDKFIHLKSSPKCVFWDDLQTDEAKEHLKNGAFVATIVNDEDEAWVLFGRHFVNVIGFLLFKEKSVSDHERFGCYNILF